MKVLPVIWLITVVCHASHPIYNQLCLKENKGFLRHPYDCHKFIRCSHQRAYEFQCPANLLWHHEIKSCDFSYRTQCKLNSHRDKKTESILLKKYQRKRKCNFADKITEKPYIENIKAFNRIMAEKLKRNTDSKRIYATTVRENVNKTGDHTKLCKTVKDVTESMFTKLNVKLTEHKNVSNTNTTYAPQKVTNVSILTQAVNEGEKHKENDNSLLDNKLLSVKDVLNHQTTATTLKDFPLFSTKNPLNALKFNSNKTLDDENNRSSLFQKTFEEISVNLTESAVSSTLNRTVLEKKANLNYQPNIFFKKISDNDNENKNFGASSLNSREIYIANYKINLTETMLTNHSADNSMLKSTASENVTELPHLTEVIDMKPETLNSSKLLTLTDNNNVKITNDKIENILSTADYSATTLNLTENSSSIFNKNLKRGFAITDENNSVNLTGAKLATYATEYNDELNSTRLKEKTNSYNLSGMTNNSGKTMSLTQYSAVQTTDGEKENIKLLEEYVENLLNSTKGLTETKKVNISTVNAFEITAGDKTVNLTESLLPSSYSTENFIEKVNRTELETKFNYLSQTKSPSIITSENTKNSINSLGLTGNNNVKLTDNENETTSLTPVNPVYMFNFIESLAEFNTTDSNFSTESPLQTIDEINSVNLTAQMLTNFSTQDLIRSALHNLTAIKNLPKTLTESSLNIFKLATDHSVEVTETESEPKLLTTKEPINSIYFTEHSSERYDVNLTFEAQAVDSTVDLTEVAVTEQNVNFDNIIAQAKVTTDDLFKWTARPVTYSGSNNIINVKLEDRLPTKTVKIIDRKNENLSKTVATDDWYNKFAQTTDFQKQKPLENKVTEAVTETPMKNVNKTNAATKFSETHNNIVGKYKNDQTKSTIPILVTTLFDNFSNDSTTDDPRLPFRALECQGSNNRRQFKATICYQYYQCFVGWAYLLNCHDGWRFQAEEEQCVLDLNQECDPK